MDWKLRNHEDFPTYSLHVGGILLEVYPHGDATDDGAVYDPAESHWQGGFWMLASGLEPHQGPLDAIQSCKPEAGTLAQKQAEVLELAEAWLREQVAAFDALGATEVKPKAGKPFCPGCNRSWFNCACDF